MDGQEPTTPTPQAGDPSGAQQPAAGDAQVAPNANAETDKLIKQLRQENAERRVREKELADKLKAFEDAKLSDADKQAKRLKELEGASEANLQRAQSLELRLNIERSARKLGIVDEDAAWALLDKGKVTRGEDGQVDPNSVDAALNELLTARKWLKGSREPNTPVVPPTNPGKTPAANVLTKQDIERMSSAEINARWDEVQQVINK